MTGPSKINHRRSAFTLAEVLIVIMVLGIALTLIYDIVQASSRVYLNGERRAELSQNGRVIIDRLIREIRQAPNILTPIPDVPDDPFFTPPQEIAFRNGHQLDPITYVRYWHNPLDHTVNRQILAYSFSTDPSTYVPYNAVDSNNQPPDEQILQDQIIGEYINDFRIWGERPITIDLNLQEADTSLYLRTQVVGRNL